jgi:hypothetical protein
MKRIAIGIISLVLATTLYAQVPTCQMITNPVTKAKFTLLQNKGVSGDEIVGGYMSISEPVEIGSNLSRCSVPVGDLQAKLDAIIYGRVFYFAAWMPGDRFHDEITFEQGQLRTYTAATTGREDAMSALSWLKYRNLIETFKKWDASYIQEQTNALTEKRKRIPTKIHY